MRIPIGFQFFGLYIITHNFSNYFFLLLNLFFLSKYFYRSYKDYPKTEFHRVSCLSYKNQRVKDKMTNITPIVVFLLAASFSVYPFLKNRERTTSSIMMARKMYCLPSLTNCNSMVHLNKPRPLQMSRNFYCLDSKEPHPEPEPELQPELDRTRAEKKKKLLQQKDLEEDSEPSHCQY